MKYLQLLAIICVINIFASNAQIDKGSFLIGNGVHGLYDKYSSTLNTDDDETKRFTLSVTPNVGYFFIKNVAVGLKEPFKYQYSKTSSDILSVGFFRKEISYNIGPFVRYYAGLNKIYVFGEIYYGFGSRHTKGNTINIENNSSIIKTKDKVNVLNSGIGLAFPVNSNIFIEGMIYYTNQTTKYGFDNQKYHSEGIGFDLSLQFILSNKTKK